ncbi:MAG: diguanylate cyclase [Acidimicrobiales bacterium]
MERPEPELTLEAVSARLEELESGFHDLEARVRELEEAGSEFRLALNRLGDALAATHDRPAMLRAVLETCALYLRASSAVFYGAVAGTGRLRPLATSGEGPAVEELKELTPGEGLAGTAAASDGVAVWPNGTAPAPSPNEPPASAAAVAVPVRSGGHDFGVLALYGRSVDRPYTEDEVESLAALVRQVETAIENTFLYEEATRLSITDGLTSLWNRRQFDLRLAAELQRAVRFHEPFSVVMMDLDQMKPINDRLGHQAGDGVLIELAHRVVGAIRDVDLVARLGGDEFGLVLPNTGVAGALRLADKVRGVIGDRPMEVDKETVEATVSVGVASYPEHGATGRELVAAADAALYRAKSAGGNRIEHAKVGG